MRRMDKKLPESATVIDTKAQTATWVRGTVKRPIETAKRALEVGVKVDPLLPVILEVLARTFESQTRFGYNAVGDPTLLLKMRRGRKIRKPETIAGIKAEIHRLNNRTKFE